MFFLPNVKEKKNLHEYCVMNEDHEHDRLARDMHADLRCGPHD